MVLFCAWIKARLVPAPFAHEVVMPKKKELSFPGEFSELPRSSPGTGNTQVLPEGPPSPPVPHKKLHCTHPLLPREGAGAARSKLREISSLVSPLQHPVLYRGGSVSFQALSFFLNF